MISEDGDPDRTGKVGDTMTITKDGKNYETKIAAVTENYMGHYIYMTGNVYEQTFGEKPNYSATVFTVKRGVQRIRI